MEYESERSVDRQSAATCNRMTYVYEFHLKTLAERNDSSRFNYVEISLHFGFSQLCLQYGYGKLRPVNGNF